MDAKRKWKARIISIWVCGLIASSCLGSLIAVGLAGNDAISITVGNVGGFFGFIAIRLWLTTPSKYTE